MSSGYYSLERGEDDGLTLLASDRDRVLDLARLCGWRDPAAAGELRGAGDGVDDDVGVLTAEQACRLADALAQAIDDIPDHDARTDKLRPSPWAGPGAAERGWLEEDPLRPLSPLEWWCGEDKEFIREVVAFCRRGGFRVVQERW
jgi:hypothetical protein